MNRRNFLTSLGLGLSSMVMVAKSPDRFRWKRPVKWVRKERLFIPNPDYHDAKFEMHLAYKVSDTDFESTIDSLTPVLFRRETFDPSEFTGELENFNFVQEPYPIRFNVPGEPIPPFIEDDSRA